MGILDFAGEFRRVDSGGAECSEQFRRRLGNIKGAYRHVALQQTVEQTVAGLGYDLIEVERSAGGLLRVTIDLPWNAPNSEAAAAGAPEPFVTVEDCEKVTRQLQFALEVDGADYKRLEVSSPGIDRPLRSEQDFERFAGEVIDITLKAPMGAAAGGQVSASRKKFRGTLERVAGADGSQGWQIVWTDEPQPKPGQKISKKRAPATLQALGFALDELREARLAPIVDFKGRRPKPGTVVSD
ncbi:Ribosome maturation factor RimP [Variovorax sp. PBL-E5]|nr:Ribosome maturation factor RimP [Variovorax sp. PBL-E5]